MPEHHASLSGAGHCFALVVSRFNEAITSRLKSGALDCLIRHDTDEKKIDVYWVPGAFEIPPVCMRLAQSDSYDAVLAIGAVIRGSTPHFDQIASVVTRGIGHASLATGVPVAYGIITADTIEQAVERAGTKAGNRGWDAAMSALEMANLHDAIASLER